MLSLLNFLENMSDSTKMILNLMTMVMAFSFLVWVILKWKKPQMGRWRTLGLALLGGGGGILAMILVVGGIGMVLR